MIEDSFPIAGGDFAEAGSASSSLKEHLKRVGVDPRAIRRTMIAAYEAEMNVVIHADKGTMHFSMDAGQLEVVVADEGPGIADIDLAMQEGYSTAPAAARQLGFGAGMGLPNIKRNSDQCSVTSMVGEGTQVAFTICLEPEQSIEADGRSIRIVAQECCGCLRCVPACPMEALRVRASTPTILDHLCIDCTACIEACPTGALALGEEDDLPDDVGDLSLVLPASFLGQFGAGVRPEQVLAALREMGFRDVTIAEAWERALHEAVVRYARDEAPALPVISPVCPVAVNLIETRYPALIEHLAPFLSPMAAVRHELGEQRAAFMVSCPAERGVLASSRSILVAPSRLHDTISRAVAAEADGGPSPAQESPAHTDVEEGVLRVSGIRHVMRTLESIENGLLGDVEVVEPLSCEQGCFGSPLWREDAFISRHRWGQWRGTTEMSPKAVRRETPFAARAGLRLDPDMAEAIRKLSAIDALTKRLPGRDCAACGAPTCAAFAEDVVLGRAAEDECKCLAKEDPT